MFFHAAEGAGAAVCRALPFVCRTIFWSGGIRWGMFSELFPGGVYFIGIGGVSMSALARLLSAHGVRVRGSDAAEGPFLSMLRKAGIPVSLGCEEIISEDTVVFTGAVDGNHPQLAAARRAGKRLLPRAELLGMIAERFKRTVSFAGCHGKTTATAMLSHILSGRLLFTCHIGGEDLTLSNYHAEGEEAFVTEACEFQRSFLALKSSIAVILNIELDHTDCYHSEEELFAAFREFAGRAERVIVNADDIRARSLPHALSFGLFSGEIRASALKSSGERYSFTVTEKGVPLVRVHLGVAGKVHIYNALAAFAAARLLGLAPQEIADGLSSFRGVKRRFEQVGFLYGVPVISDYAHHPREIVAAIQTAQAVAEGTVHVVFQPHTYTRTRDLMKDFVAALKAAESPVIYRTYAAREKFLFSGSAVMLAARLPEACYVQSPEQLWRVLAEKARPRDLILILGAGDLDAIVREMLQKTPSR